EKPQLVYEIVREERLEEVARALREQRGPILPFQRAQGRDRIGTESAAVPPGERLGMMGCDVLRDAVDRITKYVATHHPESLTWRNSRALGPDPVATLRALKREDGPALLTQGSGNFLQTLFANDLVDELRLL